MKRLNFALISDSFFVAICAFALGFALLRYFVSNLYALIFACACFAVVSGGIAFAAGYKKRKDKLFRSADESGKKSLALHLSVIDQKTLENLFKSALDGEYAANNAIETQEKLHLLRFKLSPLTPDDVAAAIKRESQKQKAILCCVASAEALSLAQDFKVEILQINEIYALLKDRELLPEKYALGEVKKRGFLFKVKKRFNRKLTPSLFLCGLGLLLLSPFTFYPIFYLVLGAVNIILSVACLFVNQSNSI